MRALIAKWHKFCVREKGHLVVGGGYLLTLAWGGHNSALMSAAYGTAALMATHAIHRSKTEEPPLERKSKHLASS